MRVIATYTCVYWLRGVGVSSEETVLQDSGHDGVAVRIVASAEPYLASHDVKLALGTGLLSHLFRGESKLNLDEHVEAVASRLQAERAAKYRNSSFLIVQAKETRDLPESAKVDNRSSYHVVLRSPDEADLRKRGRVHLHTAMAALNAAIETLEGTERVAEGVVYVRDADGMPIFPIGFDVRADLFVTRNMNAEEVQFVRDSISGSMQAFENVGRLLLDSLDNRRDAQRAFLSAWMALEVLLNALFDTYRKRFFRAWVDRAALAEGHFVDRYLDLVRNNFRPRDKFVAVAMQLAPDDFSEDLAAFQRIQKVRNEFAHGQVVEETEMDAAATRRLVRKYLRLHRLGDKPPRNDS